MEVGESIADAVRREVREETGLDVEVVGIVGIYSDPHHVVQFREGEVGQQFSICFACKVVGGSIQSSSESSEVRFVDPNEIDQLDIHPSIRLRIQHYLDRRSDPVLA